MNTEIVREWTTELRTDGRKQAKGQLHRVDEDGTHSFCCLGVLEDMLAQRGIETAVEEEGYVAYQTQDSYGMSALESGVLTESAREYVGFEDRNPSIELPIVSHPHEDDEGRLSSYRLSSYTLAQLNDGGMTFDQIADVIDYFFGS